MKKLVRSPAVVLVLLAAHWQANAWDGEVNGVISSIHSVRNAGNYDFRVVLPNQPGPWCGPGSGGGWAALHADKPNSRACKPR